MLFFVGTRPICSHFLCGNASPCRPVPPLSRRTHCVVIVKVRPCCSLFLPEKLHIIGRLFLYPKKRTASALFGNPTLSAALGKRFFRLAKSRASEHALICSLFLPEKHHTIGRLFLYPKKRTALVLFGNPTLSATLGERFFRLAKSRTGSSVTLVGDHAGSPLRMALERALYRSF